MDKTTFYNTLEPLSSFDERIEYIKTTKYELAGETQPDSILFNVFSDALTYQHATHIVHAFKMRFGEIILCRDASAVLQQPMTLLDVVDRTIEHDAFFGRTEDRQIALSEIKWMLEFNGCKRSKEYAPNVLYDLFFAYGADRNNPGYMSAFSYNYDLMRNNPRIDGEELAQVVFHPSRISKWISAGNAVDDFMN